MIHTLFPLVVGEYSYPHKNDIKDYFFKKYDSYFVTNPDGTVYAGENTGITNFHTDGGYQPLYEFITECVRKQFDELKFDHSIFDIVFTKTWLNVVDDAYSTPPHIHDTSHYSFVYYFNTPVNSDLLCFSVNENPNQPFTGSFYDYNSDDSVVRSLITEFTKLNSSVWKFNVEEGKLFLFPSNTIHFTEKIGSVGSDVRISFAGDIFLIYKEQIKSNYPTGVFPVSQWRKFD
jgi:hypothetical protein